MNDIPSWESFKKSVDSEVESLLSTVHVYEHLLPAVNWITHRLWDEASWSATTFCWHPTGDAPPVMGLVFDKADEARQLFRDWTRKHGNRDELEEIKITIIEGDVPGEKPGYSVHLCPDPENSLVRATGEGVVLHELPLALLGQVRRMNPIPGSTPLLPRFKEQFARHNEFLLAPVGVLPIF